MKVSIILLGVLSSFCLAVAQTNTETSAPQQHKCVAKLPAEEPACWSSLDDIWCREWIVGQDISVKRTYYLCPGTYIIGQPNPETGDASDDFLGGQRNLFPTPNMNVICGEKGKPSTQSLASTDCILTGGVYQILGAQGGILGDNFFQGITFAGAFLYNVAVADGASQNMKFKDCVFKDNTNLAVFQVNPDENSQLELTYEFEDVLFENNNVSPTGKGNNGIITQYHNMSSLIFTRVIFRNNKFNEESEEIGYAVSAEGKVTFDQVCIEDNKFKKNGPILAYGDLVTASGVYGANNNDDLACAFVYDTKSQTCSENFDADICFDTPVTTAPTEAPSMTPTGESTTAETEAPVDASDGHSLKVELSIFSGLVLIAFI